MNLVVATQLVNLLGCAVGGALSLFLGTAVVPEKYESSAGKPGKKTPRDFSGRADRFSLSVRSAPSEFRAIQHRSGNGLFGGQIVPVLTALVYAALGFCPPWLSRSNRATKRKKTRKL